MEFKRNINILQTIHSSFFNQVSDIVNYCGEVVAMDYYPQKEYLNKFVSCLDGIKVESFLALGKM